MLVLLLAIAAATPADPAPARDSSEDVSPTPSFQSDVETAKNTYFSGDMVGAREQFQALQVRVLGGEPVAPDARNEAMMYLGEIYFQDGDDQAAREVFRTILTMDPEAQMSAYYHPIEVVGLFEMVRGSIFVEEPEEPVRRPLPAWGYFPLGIPQFAQKRPVAGALFGGLQLGLGTTGMVVYSRLRAENFDQDPDKLTGWSKAQVQRVRFATQWPTTIGAYTLWVASSFDAGRHHRKKGPTVVFLPGAHDQPWTVAVDGPW